MLSRPPIIVVMGHVDHGKTTLLDYIRKTNVAAKETGGITQAIGAYEISHNGKKITFIGTPGHEAFSKMRARGAHVADLAILVVAADDGVMPQTKESIEILKNSDTLFVVAVNKTDRAGADVDRTKQQLAEAGVFLEGYGGNVSWEAISAKTGQGVSKLLDLILLAAELEDLKYDPDGRTEGIVLTARPDPRKGNIVTAVVKNGRLLTNQAIATATAMGKIKALENFLGKKAEKLEPSAPAIIYGFESLPEIGEEFYAGSDKIALIAEEITKLVKDRSETIKAAAPEAAEGVKLILRADESGSLEVMEGLIQKISADVPRTIIDASVGDIHENEVKLATGTGAVIIGFKVKTDKAAENLARGQNVEIIISDVIYDLEKILKEHFQKSGFAVKAELEILAVFGERKEKNQIVGGRVTKGVIGNKDVFEIQRNEEILGKGRVINLQSQRKDIPEGREGQEVGLLVESDAAITIGDKLIFKS